MLTLVALLGLALPRTAALAAPATTRPGNSPLGATPQEIIGRYGPVLVHHARVRHRLVITGGTAMDGDLHGKDGLVIRVVYHQNRAVLLEFVRAEGNLTPVDITALLASCDEGSTWEMGKDSTGAAKFYHRADNHAVAHWAVEDGSLLVAAEGDKAGSDLMDRLLQ